MTQGDGERDLDRRPTGATDAAVKAAGVMSETLEVVEEYDDGYYATLRDLERRVHAAVPRTEEPA